MRSLVPMFGLVLAACQHDIEAPVAPCHDCVLTNANNFAYTSKLEIGTSLLRAETDGTIRWDTLTKDVRGGALDPRRDLDEARLIAFRDLDPDTLAHALAHDDLQQADVSVFVTCTPRDAACAFSEFGMFGNTVDIQQYFVEGYGTWLLALGKQGNPGADALMFLQADADVDSVDARLTDATSRLEVEVDLASLTPLVVPARDPFVTVDWSGLTRDGLGDELDHATLDELWVARFTESPEALASDVFSLEDRAQVTWTLDVADLGGADLADLVGPGSFAGVDTTGTWLLGLRCRTCTNPAPRFVTVLTGVE